MLHRADVQRATAAAAMQHARASKVNVRTARRQRVHRPLRRIRETITSGLKIYIAVRENREGGGGQGGEKERREKGEKGRIVVCQI